ncbi:MAG TPA: hypothetical protein VHW09_17780 [Bryobacteraceae bacterium]|nr:hypothetical protein [Bryobacteraceae bacterium]
MEWLLLYVVTTMPEFSRPVTGKDSVWYCLVVRNGDILSLAAHENPSTRHRAMAEIADILRGLARQEKTVLAGFDFPYGYPAGLAAALGVTDTPAWLGVWHEITGRIVDRGDNGNNRFEVAGDLNRRVSGVCHPFWGCPQSCQTNTMSCTKSGSGPLAEKRLTDVGNMQPIWKLYGNGSVGSQALLGIPHLSALRNDAELAPVSRVWPFETGLSALPKRQERDYLIVHAEIYPSLLLNESTPEEVKDAAQVRTMAFHFAALDDEEELSSLFAGPTCLTREQRLSVEREEGWTLGVLSGRQMQPRLALPSLTVTRPTTGGVTELIGRDNNLQASNLVSSEAELPECDFVYFATPSCGSWTITAEFVDSARAIIAHAYNNAGLRMPLIQRLRLGHHILLVYGADGKYAPVFRCQVCLSPEPVRTPEHTFDVFCYIAEEFHDRLKAEGYAPDPVVRRFTGISIGSLQDLQNIECTITKPKGNNTLRRWDEVFGSSAEHKSK